MPKAMTDEEIVTSYRQAKYPGDQVKIIADLAACSVDTIKQVLLNNGIQEIAKPVGRRRSRYKAKALDSSANTVKGA